uniref:Reverse transcriptase domain-containing protein n=1 Tax=Oryzias sinensis TaxID=183150 RepID=A0A8C7WUK6_9TELE
MPASASLCEDFADHLRSKIDSVRSNIIKGQKRLFIGNDGLILPEEALDSFDLVEAETLGRVFSQVNPTTCFLDPIPTSLFKSFYWSFESEILNIMNSLQTSIFPADFKTAVVKPLLKKTNLDPSVFKNYRPVSNLPFFSKVLEKLVFIQLNEFLLQNNIFEINQSGFRTNHSTETALLKIVNDVRCALDSGQISVLVLLDLSAAFDTVDHMILVNRHKSLGLSGTVLKWFKSYLMERNFMVSMDTHFSGVHEINCGVPQGSILGPLLFKIYMLPLGNVIRSHNISFHSYADDTQLYIAMSPDDTRPLEALFNCILDGKLWMANNFLQLNQEKTEIIVIGPEAKREKQFLKLQELSLSHSETISNLGVIFDSKLTF